VIGSGGRRLAMAALAVGLVAVGGLLALSVSLVTTDSKDRRGELTVVVGPGGSTAPAPVLSPTPRATSTREAAPGRRAVVVASGGASGAPGETGPAHVVPVALPVSPSAGDPGAPAPRGHRSRPAPRPPVGVRTPVVGVPISAPSTPVAMPVAPPATIAPPPPSSPAPSPPPPDPGRPAPGTTSPEGPGATSPPPSEGTDPGGSDAPGWKKPPPASSADCPPDPCPPDPCPPDPCPPDPCPPDASS
jgi:hypothetical protein